MIQTLFPPPALAHVPLAGRPLPDHHVCARTIRAAYDGEFMPGAALRLAIVRDGPYALVSWATGEAGGMAVFHRQSEMWCRLTGGGGALRESDLIGLDGIDRESAHRLFHGSAKIDIRDAR